MDEGTDPQLKKSFNIKARRWAGVIFGAIFLLNAVLGIIDLVLRFLLSKPIDPYKIFYAIFYTVFGLLFVAIATNFNGILTAGRKYDPSQEPQTTKEKLGTAAYLASGGASPLAYILNPQLGNKYFRIFMIVIGSLLALFFLLIGGMLIFYQLNLKN